MIACTLTAVCLSIALQIPHPSKPVGFNIESNVLPGPVVGALGDGSLLISTGGFGTSGLDIVGHGENPSTFASGFGSVAGVAISPLTGALLVGDSAPEFSVTGQPLNILQDLNGDGDVLDQGEHIAHPATLPILSNGASILPFIIEYEPTANRFLVSGSTPFGSAPTLGAIIAVGETEAHIWASGFGYAADMVADGQTLYLADLDANSFVGRVYALSDNNGDDDALDSGEQTIFADGLSGASGLVRVKGGDFLLSGTFASDWGSGSITRLENDRNGDGVADQVNQDWWTGFGFTTGLHLIEGQGGLVPGSGGDGFLHVMDFYDAFPAPPTDRRIRSAPLCDLSISGNVANNSVFTLTNTGWGTGNVVWVLSLDQSGVTLGGIGDLQVGFSAPFVMTSPVPLDATGQADLSVLLHEVGAAVGLAFTAQAFVLKNNDVGVSNALNLVIGP